MCRLADPAEYARNEQLESEHPSYAYVREDRIIEHLDPWLAQLFDPKCIDTTLAQLANANTRDPRSDHQAELARRRIDQADAKLERYRIALESGTDPALIAEWTARTQSDRLAAQTELAGLDQPEVVTADDLAQLIDNIRQTWGDFARALANSNPDDKAALLNEGSFRRSVSPGVT